MNAAAKKQPEKATNDITHITVLIDRSGSMEAIRDDTIGGFNAFLQKQQEEPGEATLSLIQFDSGDPYEVIHDFAPLAKIPKLTRKTFVPRGATPLLDAMGRTINELEKHLADLPAKKQPGQVVVVIITDGQENASQEFKKDQVTKMIKAKQTDADWQFVFLSADLAAIEDAMSAGVAASASMAFDATSQGVAMAWVSTSDRIADYRARRRQDVSFMEDDRARQSAEKKRKS